VDELSRACSTRESDEKHIKYWPENFKRKPRLHYRILLKFILMNWVWAKLIWIRI
jgi:hypothetical protein